MFILQYRLLLRELLSMQPEHRVLQTVLVAVAEPRFARLHEIDGLEQGLAEPRMMK